MKKVLTMLLLFVFGLSVPVLAHGSDNKTEKFKIEKSILKADLVSVECKVASAVDNHVIKEPQIGFLYQHRFDQESCSFNSEVRFIYPNQLFTNSNYTKLPDKIDKK